MAIVLFSPSPRPAKELPKVSSSCAIAILVRLSNILKKFCICTGSPDCEAEIVAPSGSFALERPRVSSRYFRPIVETDSTRVRVSTGSGPACFSSLRLTIAVILPVAGFWWGTSPLTIPTRLPASRTWLPFSRP